MRFSKTVFMMLCFSLPLSLFAQEVVGKWHSEIPTEDGGTMVMAVSINADGTYGVDFGDDGQVEINGKYEISPGQITVENVSGDECTGKGVYNFKVTNTDLIMNRVSDPCPNRGGPEGIMRFTRK